MLADGWPALTSHPLHPDWAGVGWREASPYLATRAVAAGVPAGRPAWTSTTLRWWDAAELSERQVRTQVEAEVALPYERSAAARRVVR